MNLKKRDIKAKPLKKKKPRPECWMCQHYVDGIMTGKLQTYFCKETKKEVSKFDRCCDEFTIRKKLFCKLIYGTSQAIKLGSCQVPHRRCLLKAKKDAPCTKNCDPFRAFVRALEFHNRLEKKREAKRQKTFQEEISKLNLRRR